jgi:NhaP-type Na+/H+ or K+/H+ antiporter
MLLSVALIFTIGLLLGELFGKIRLPKFLGMILTGIVLSSFISPEIYAISEDLRKIALIVILLRAGLNLDITDLKKIGLPAILMSFIPATLEIGAVVIFAPILFDVSYLEAAILGSVLAAVSPAVVVPRMIKLINERYGYKKRIPHLIMASASVDDIYVIVLFTSFISMYQSNSFTVSSLILIPVAIIIGIVVGIIIGFLLSKLFHLLRVRDTIKVLIIIAVGIYIVVFEDAINTVVPFSALLSVMVLGITFLHQSEERALRLREKYDKVWVFAELVLFTLIGAEVDMTVAFTVGLTALLLLLIELVFRIFGVFLSTIKTDLTKKEKLFTGISYLPKATVQAAIGAIPYSLGIPSGELILAVAVLSIIVTAPIGALGIDLTYKKALKQE